MVDTNKDDLLPGVAYFPSLNCDYRPDDIRVDLVVVHGISVPAGCFGGGAINDLFLNRLDCSASPLLKPLAGLRVSAHLLIDRGGKITQFVPFNRRAWHAGKSVWGGRELCNDYSIGIELEGTDQLAYTPRQYDQLVGVIGEIIRSYPHITPARVVGHSDIAPGRKTDPGQAFNWPALHRRLAVCEQKPAESG